MFLREYAFKNNRTANFLTMLAKKGELPGVHKEPAIRYQKSKKGKWVKVVRQMWVVDDEEALTTYLQKKKERQQLVFRDGWTRASLECYEARMRCANCSNNYICNDFTKKGQVPPMKNKVIELVKKYGRPPERIIENGTI